MAKRIAWTPGYEGDEVALGVGLAIALHAIPILAIVLKALYPSTDAPEEPAIAHPVIGATLLKLGKPLDPKQLPDRLIPKARTAPQQKLTASTEDPAKKPPPPDAGPPPPNAQDSDIQRLIAKSDPFAEDAGKVRPEQGFENGSDAGQETDPNKVHAGDVYAAQLGAFLHERWQYPTVISQGEANKLCVIVQIAISPRMQVWHVRQAPIRASGNDLFDGSALEMLRKLMDDRTQLPEPPAEAADGYRGKTVNIGLAGDMHGDSSRCR